MSTGSRGVPEPPRRVFLVRRHQYGAVAPHDDVGPLNANTFWGRNGKPCDHFRPAIARAGRGPHRYLRENGPPHLGGSAPPGPPWTPGLPPGGPGGSSIPPGGTCERFGGIPEWIEVKDGGRRGDSANTNVALHEETCDSGMDGKFKMERLRPPRAHSIVVGSTVFTRLIMI